MPDEPMPLVKAANALGVTKEALRQRIKRGQAEAFRDNRGRWMVLLAETDRQGLAPPSPKADELAAAKVELIRWQTLAEQLGVRLADRDRELANVREREQQLLAMVERMTLERRSLWQELKEWLVRRLR